MTASVTNFTKKRRGSRNLASLGLAGLLALSVGGLFGACSGAQVGNGTGVCDPACAEDQECVDGACLSKIRCSTGEDCPGDMWCQGDRCTPYSIDHPNDPTCSRLVPVGLLSPQIYCEWLKPEATDPYPNHKQVLSTPLVVDFNYVGRGSETLTIHPSIVMNSYNGLDGGCGIGTGTYGILRVLDGRTCTQQHLIPVPVNGSATPALGDLNGDGVADIVAYSATGGLVAFTFDRNQNKFVTLWTSKTGAGAAYDPFAGICEWTGPAIHDLDNDGKPEVIAEGFVFNSAGVLIDNSVNLRTTNQNVGQFSVVADIDKDGVPNLVGPYATYSWDKATSKWKKDRDLPVPSGVTANRAFVAVADFGTANGTNLDRATTDGIAEIAIIMNGRAWVVSKDGAVVFGPLSLPGSAGGGPPTVGDFDNDGRPELAAAGSNSYTVFDPDCVSGGQEKYCPSKATDSILWTNQSQDQSSNITGSSLFDFEADGTAEAVYADECFARIYSGKTGEVLFSQAHSSCTWNEYPVVADVAGNFRSKLIVPSNENCNVSCPAVDPVFKGLRCSSSADCPNGIGCDQGYCRCTADAQCNTTSVGGGFVCRPPATGVPGTGNTCRAAFTGKRTGIRVFGDVADRWAASRPLWNQHTYSITNIDDRGVIPVSSQWQRNWEMPNYNNFRMNVQGKLSASASGDVTAPNAQGTAECQDGSVRLITNVCNRGTAPVVDETPVSFYEGTQLLCTAETREALPPGSCTQVSCTTPLTQSGSHTVKVVADDDGTGQGLTSECRESNNTGTFTFGC